MVSRPRISLQEVVLSGSLGPKRRIQCSEVQVSKPSLGAKFSQEFPEQLSARKKNLFGQKSPLLHCSLFPPHPNLPEHLKAASVSKWNSKVPDSLVQRVRSLLQYTPPATRREEETANVCSAVGDNLPNRQTLLKNRCVAMHNTWLYTVALTNALEEDAVWLSPPAREW